MNREIKFRLWDGEDMQMLDNLLVGVGQIGFSDSHYVDLNDHDHEKAQLMQYTGLKDKHGVEIYEGDIIADIASKLVPVIWDETNARFAVRSKDNYDSQLRKIAAEESKPFIMGITQFITTHWEVTGNIHANPELLGATS